MKPKTRKLLLLACVIALAVCLVLIYLEEARPEPAAPSLSAEAAPEQAPFEAGFSILFIDVGQADSMLVRCGGESMLVDGGNVGDSDLLATVLKKQGVDELDYVVCTHAHEDHAGGLPGALHQAKLERALAPVREASNRPFSKFVQAAEQQGVSIEVPEPDDTFPLGDATVEVLGPREDYDETNNTSLVLRLTYGDTRFLLTGDMESDAEQDLLDAGCDVSADLLKVGHHGSSSSSSHRFLEAVAPEYAVISCEQGNDYGHPHDETLQALSDAAVKLYRTDMQGDILAESDGKSIHITTARNQNAETNPYGMEGAPDYYIGNRTSLKFHRPSCSGLPAPSNRIRFDSRDEALSAGYAPCGLCRP